MRHAPVNKLKQLYDVEFKKYRQELENSKEKTDKVLLKQFDCHKQKYADALLEHYYRKCSSLHKLAFCQFRKVLPNARLAELREIVINRKALIKRVLDKVDELRKQEKPRLEPPNSSMARAFKAKIKKDPVVVVKKEEEEEEKFTEETIASDDDEDLIQ